MALGNNALAQGFRGRLIRDGWPERAWFERGFEPTRCPEYRHGNDEAVGRYLRRRSFC